MITIAPAFPSHFRLLRGGKFSSARRVRRRVRGGPGLCSARTRVYRGARLVVIQTDGERLAVLSCRRCTRSGLHVFGPLGSEQPARSVLRADGHADHFPGQLQVRVHYACGLVSLRHLLGEPMCAFLIIAFKLIFPESPLAPCSHGISPCVIARFFFHRNLPGAT